MSILKVIGGMKAVELVESNYREALIALSDKDRLFTAHLSSRKLHRSIDFMLIVVILSLSAHRTIQSRQMFAFWNWLQHMNKCNTIDTVH